MNRHIDTQYIILTAKKISQQQTDCFCFALCLQDKHDDHLVFNIVIDCLSEYSYCLAYIYSTQRGIQSRCSEN